MILEKYFFPDIKYNSINEIDVNKLKNMGINFVILDIDNTLVPYTMARPDENALNFLQKLSKNGISYCFVSNNNRERVAVFNEQIGAQFFARGAKPLLFGINRAMREHGAKRENTALIGDQVFTDVCGAKRAGIYSILVDPIKECTSAFFRFKRYFEKKIIAKYLSK